MHSYSWDADILALIIFVCVCVCCVCRWVCGWVHACLGAHMEVISFKGLILSLYLDSEATSSLLSLGCILLASKP